VVDVTEDTFAAELQTAVAVTPGLTVYCAGIGEAFDVSAIPFERKVFEVNLMGAVKVIETVLPNLIADKGGQIIVLSSLADVIISPEAPSYSASKAALSSYVEGVALAVRQYGVAVTNVRFGFVDTKMAKGEGQPLMMTVDRAVEHLLVCIRKQPIRYSRPRLMAVIVLLVRWFVRAKVIFIGRPH
jgi:short-subunit dehydrogenase